MTKSKDDKKAPAQDGEPDFEKLYYQAMKENMLLRDDKIAVTFTTEEINLLRLVMFEELYDIRDRVYMTSSFGDDEDEDRKILNKKDDDALMKTMLSERKTTAENIVKKLRFEL